MRVFSCRANSSGVGRASTAAIRIRRGGFLRFAGCQRRSCYLSDHQFHRITPGIKWAIDNHASQFNNKNDAVPAVMYSAVEDTITKVGYRFVLTSAR
jgi:hypothetical protein